MQWSWPRYFIKMLIADFYNGFTLLFSSNAGSFSMTTNSMISIFYQQGTNHSTYIVLHFLKTFSYQAVHVFLRWLMANKPLVFFVLKMFFICLVLQKNDLHLIFLNMPTVQVLNCLCRSEQTTNPKSKLNV